MKKITIIIFSLLIVGVVVLNVPQKEKALSNNVEKQITQETTTKNTVEANVVKNNKIKTEMELPPVSGNFKTYMDYRAITDTSSPQYNLQLKAYTGEMGIRKIGDRYMVALGTYYAKVGDEFDITLSTGKIIHAIVGDIKSNVHTDKTNRFIVHNGNIVEFIVCTSSMPSLNKKLGTMGTGFLEGDIIKIEKVVKN